MNEQQREQLAIYRNQIIALCFALLAVIISLSIIFDLIRITRGEDCDGSLQANVVRKSELAAIIVLLIALYFAYRAWADYKKDPSKANSAFLIAVLLALLAAFIRYVTIKKSQEIEGAQDIV